MNHPAHIGYCDACNGPIIAQSRFELVRDWLAYELFMALPWAIAKTRFGFWLLPYVGGHAYTCTCPEKVLAR